MYNAFEDAIERIKKSTGARTQVDLANILGIRQSSISDAKRRQSVPAEWLLKLYRTHGLNPDWILEGVDPQYLKEVVSAPKGLNETMAVYSLSRPRFRTLQVYSMTEYPDRQGYSHVAPIEAITVPEHFYRPALMVVKMDSTAMEPLIRRGAYVGIDRDQRQILSGEIYAVAVPPEGLAVKRVSHDTESSRLMLKSENPVHHDQTLSMEAFQESIVGRAIWVIQEI